ncbi:F-box/WD repeat-containing protein 12-like isoform X2 [Ochotona princeps]|uniref:F-box/WD repeat-containing protein 12-like isoform X2 n=1 Tax=Ochotona princeps TaxID=9978 RepID=UPI00271475AB|nr:F-box/WD repeat-containing protein 12-like isoform X2 [Ochotona princeps]
MEPALGAHELLHVFSFLEARDLLCAAQVDKMWNEVARTEELWRQLCCRRWSSFKASGIVPGTQTWKEYYLCRSELEFRMESGRPGKDFVCTALAGHIGSIDGLAYISTNECRFDGREKSVVCSVSSDSTVRAWDLREGKEIWCSPCQPTALVNLVTYPQLQLVVTVDEQGLIKAWEAETGRERASFCLPTSSSALEACNHPEGPFLLLLCSPDCQWVFASTQNSDLDPKVFHTASLLYPLDDETPVFTTFSSCVRPQACWAPAEAARLIVMHPDGNSMQLVITTYELRAKKCKKKVDIVVQQIASFLLPDTIKPPNLMKSHGSQVLLLVSGLQLVLFTIHGLQLAAFQDHQRPITSVWVDPSRVITSSLDLSLRVYVWNKEKKFPVLKSCYHLLGGSHRWASGYMHVESDSRSIVGVEARSVGTSVLRSFCFRVERG